MIALRFIDDQGRESCLEVVQLSSSDLLPTLTGWIGVILTEKRFGTTHSKL